MFVIRDVFLYLEEIQKHLKRKKKKLQFAGKSSSAKNHQSIFRNSDSQEGWDGGTVREGSQRKRETKNVVKGIHRKKKKQNIFTTENTDQQLQIDLLLWLNK